VAVTVGVVVGWGCRRIGAGGSATVNAGTVTVNVGPVTVKAGVVTVVEVVVAPPPPGSVAVGVVIVGEVSVPPVDTVSVTAVEAASIALPANADAAHTPSTRSEIREIGARAPRRTMTRTLPEIPDG
jgi:hypothetical protein